MVNKYELEQELANKGQPRTEKKQFKVGDIVVPSHGVHAGDPHTVVSTSEDSHPDYRKTGDPNKYRVIPTLPGGKNNYYSGEAIVDSEILDKADKVDKTNNEETIVQKYTDFLNSGFGKTGNIFAEAKKALSKKEIETALKSDEAKAKPKDKVTLKKAPWEEETQINEDDYAKEMYKKGASAAVMQSVPPGPRAHPEYVRGYKEKTAELNKKYGIKENNIFSDNELAHIMSISESDYSSAENDYDDEKNSKYKKKIKEMYAGKARYEEAPSLYRHEYHEGKEHFGKGNGDFDFYGNPYHHADPRYHAWRQGHLDAAGPEDDEDK